MITACPFVHRVLLACNVRKIGTEHMRKTLINLDNPPHQMLKINPSGSVPTIEFADGEGFHESLIIMEFLDSLSADGPKIYGDTARQTGQTKVLWEGANSKLLSAVQQAIYSFGNVNTIRSANEALKSGWHWLSDQLEKSGGHFFGGYELNAVDIGLAPFLLRLRYVAEVYPSVEMPTPRSAADNYLARITERCSVSGVFPDEGVMRETTLKFAHPHRLFKAVQEAPRSLIENPVAAVKAENEYLSAWAVEKDEHGFCLRATFKFNSHADAVSKVKWLHDAQEICDHHTSFTLRDFTSIEILLVTHEPRWGVTQKDLTMAKLLQTYFVKGQLPS
jgi:glutathione S-transferase/pterin-4a-carbinolamine dehydratase